MSQNNVTQKLRDLSIRNTCPDNAISMTLSRREGINVDLSHDIAELYSEQELAEQIEEQWMDLLEKYRLTYETLTTQDSSRFKRDVEQRKAHRSRLEAHIQEISIEKRSPSRRVAIDWQGRADIVIQIRDGSLTSCALDELAGEINSTIAEATRAHSSYIRKIQRVVYKGE